MTFGEKIRAGRLAMGYSQREVAEQTGLSLRTVQNYESGAKMPKKEKTYQLLSRALDIPLKVLTDDGEALTLSENDRYGLRAASEARRLVDEVSILYSGGDLCEEDMDAMMRAIQDAYWIAKDRNRRIRERDRTLSGANGGEGR